MLKLGVRDFLTWYMQVSTGEEKMDKPMMKIGKTLLSLWVKPLNSDSVKRY